MFVHLQTPHNGIVFIPLLLDINIYMYISNITYSGGPSLFVHTYVNIIDKSLNININININITYIY